MRLVTAPPRTNTLSVRGLLREGREGHRSCEASLSLRSWNQAVTHLETYSMQKDPVVVKASELLRLGLMPSASEIKAGKVLTSVPHFDTTLAHVKYRISCLWTLRPSARRRKSCSRIGRQLELVGYGYGRKRITNCCTSNQLIVPAQADVSYASVRVPPPRRVATRA